MYKRMRKNKPVHRREHEQAQAQAHDNNMKKEKLPKLFYCQKDMSGKLQKKKNINAEHIKSLMKTIFVLLFKFEIK